MDELKLHYVLGHDVRQDLGLALSLLAPAWWLAARNFAHAREAIRWLAGFNLFSSAALVGVGFLPTVEVRGWHVVVHLLQLAAWIALWRTGACLTRARDAGWLQALMAGLAAAVLLSASSRGVTVDILLALACAAQALVLACGSVQVIRQLLRLGQRRHAVLIGLGAGMMAMLLTVRAYGAWTIGGDVDRVYLVSLWLGYAALPTALAVNMTLACHMFGDLVRAIDRLSRPVAAPETPVLGLVEHVLVSEMAALRAGGRALVVAALVADDAAVGGVLGGAPGGGPPAAGQRARQDAELERLLRRELGAADLLGRTDDGLFLMALPQTDAPRARALLDELRRAALSAVQPARGAVSIGVGQVVVLPDDDLATAVRVVRARCRADRMAGLMA
ncbi:MAG: hypothetical protein RLY78_2890 [Pseudomonadota bacterium]|jgi:hypothetical protein|uniref:GGDEF domain-containing protein n=1 Tax=Pseudaquabacterium rugosum TaxID=2984194 RepID=A0ABU9B973_9BURK